MIHISGAFVYQPPSSPRPGVAYPETFLIKLIIMSDDGAPVLPDTQDEHGGVAQGEHPESVISGADWPEDAHGGAGMLNVAGVRAVSVAGCSRSVPPAVSGHAGVPGRRVSLRA